MRADVLEREVWEAVNSVLLRPDLLRAGLKKMIESKRTLLATKPEEQIARWGEQLERAKTKRSRDQDQEAEGLMTREELRAKLAELDETVALAGAEIEKLRVHEESIRAIERSGEELLERYAKLVPKELANLSPAERRHVHQILQSVSRCPRRVRSVLRCPSLSTREHFVVRRL